MNPAKKTGCVLRPDRPWASRDIGFCVSVIQLDGKYKMWHMAREKDVNKEPIRFCYAESKDGNDGLIQEVV